MGREIERDDLAEAREMAEAGERADEGGEQERGRRRRRRRGGRDRNRERGRAPEVRSDAPFDESNIGGTEEEFLAGEEVYSEFEVEADAGREVGTTDDEPRDEVEVVEPEALDQAEDRERRRRRHRGRGRGRKPAEGGVEKITARTAEERAPLAADDAHEVELEAEEADEEALGEDDDSGKPTHRGIPTWSETIGVIISANMAARAKNPRGSGASSPRRGGNGRGSRGRGRGRPSGS